MWCKTVKKEWIRFKRFEKSIPNNRLKWVRRTSVNAKQDNRVNKEFCLQKLNLCFRLFWLLLWVSLLLLTVLLVSLVSVGSYIHSALIQKTSTIFVEKEKDYIIDYFKVINWARATQYMRYLQLVTLWFLGLLFLRGFKFKMTKIIIKTPEK
jgi:hypothetical protein